MKPTDGAQCAISRIRQTTGAGRGAGENWRMSRRVRMMRYSASFSSSENESMMITISMEIAGGQQTNWKLYIRRNRVGAVRQKKPRMGRMALINPRDSRNPRLVG